MRSDNREYREAIKYVFHLDAYNERFEKGVADIYKENLAEKTLIYPGVEKVIKHLDSINKPWGIVTTKKRDFVENILLDKPIFKSRQFLICGDDVTRKKPDPESLSLACEKLKVAPSSAVYIGDLESDEKAAKSAGLHFICALYGYLPDTKEALLTWRADYHINQIDDLLTT